MGYGREIQNQFAKTYTKMGNATHALQMVLGEERAGRMKPHTLRAKPSWNKVRFTFCVSSYRKQHRA